MNTSKTPVTFNNPRWCNKFSLKMQSADTMLDYIYRNDELTLDKFCNILPTSLYKLLWNRIVSILTTNEANLERIPKMLNNESYEEMMREYLRFAIHNRNPDVDIAYVKSAVPRSMYEPFLIEYFADPVVWFEHVAKEYDMCESEIPDIWHMSKLTIEQAAVIRNYPDCDVDFAISQCRMSIEIEQWKCGNQNFCLLCILHMGRWFESTNVTRTVILTSENLKRLVYRNPTVWCSRCLKMPLFRINSECQTSHFDDGNNYAYDGNEDE